MSSPPPPSSAPPPVPPFSPSLMSTTPRHDGGGNVMDPQSTDSHTNTNPSSSSLSFSSSPPNSDSFLTDFDDDDEDDHLHPPRSGSVIDVSSLLIPHYHQHDGDDNDNDSENGPSAAKIWESEIAKRLEISSPRASSASIGNPILNVNSFNWSLSAPLQTATITPSPSSPLSLSLSSSSSSISEPLSAVHNVGVSTSLSILSSSASPSPSQAVGPSGQRKSLSNAAMGALRAAHSSFSNENDNTNGNGTVTPNSVTIGTTGTSISSPSPSPSPSSSSSSSSRLILSIEEQLKILQIQQLQLAEKQKHIAILQANMGNNGNVGGTQQRNSNSNLATSLSANPSDVSHTRRRSSAFLTEKIEKFSSPTTLPMNTFGSSNPIGTSGGTVSTLSNNIPLVAIPKDKPSTPQDSASIIAEISEKDKEKSVSISSDSVSSVPTQPISPSPSPSSQTFSPLSSPSPSSLPSATNSAVDMANPPTPNKSDRIEERESRSSISSNSNSTNAQVAAAASSLSSSTSPSSPFIVRGSVSRNSTSLSSSPSGLPLSPSSPASSKTKCSSSKCMSFAVRGNFCLRHLWQEDHQWTPKEDYKSDKQWKVAMEIITTERSYCDALRIATKSFHSRMVQYESLGSPMVKKEDLHFIFNNLIDIFQLAESMINDLDEIHKEGVLLKQIGASLLHYAPQFRIYQPYLENYDLAIKRLSAVRKENSQFDLFLKVNEQCEGMSLQSFLIMPVQRLPRYLMLLSELIKRTNSEHPGLELMTEAQQRISRIAESINTSLHSKDSLAVVKQIEDQFEKDSRFEEFAVSGRCLVKEGPLKKKFSKFSKHLSSHKIYHFFLFNDLLIYADASKNIMGKGVTFKMKHVVPLLDMEVKENSKGSKEFSLDIKNSTLGKQFTVLCESELHCREWKNILTECIMKLKNTHRDMRVNSFDGSTEAEKKPKNMSKFKNMMGIEE